MRVIRKSNSDEGLEFRLTESLQRRPAHLWRSDKTEERDFRLPRTAHWEGKYLGGNWWVRFAHRFLWWGLWAGKLKQNLYPAFRQKRGRIEGVLLAFAVSQWPSAWNYFPWRREWQPIPVFLPGEFHRQKSLASYSPWSCKESATTEWLTHTHTHTHTWNQNTKVLI